MGASKYIYTVYDAKTGEYVAKGTAAQLAGKGIFKDAGSVSTCYLSNRKTDKPRRWRMERVEVGPLSAQSGTAGAACSAPFWRVAPPPPAGGVFPEGVSPWHVGFDIAGRAKPDLALSSGLRDRDKLCCSIFFH